MKVLFISTSLPPQRDSQAIRNLFFIKAMINSGIEVRIVTLTSGNDEPWDYYKEIGVEPIFVKCTKLRSLLSNIGNVTVLKPISYILNNLMMYALCPDMDVGWEKKVVAAIADTNFDYNVVVSASGSYTAHMAARTLAEQSRVPHVAELGDPWADNPIWPENMFHKKIVNTFLERQALKYADNITTTNIATKKLYQTKYPDKKVHSIPMGFDSHEISLNQCELLDCFKNEASSIRFSHVGVSYKASRDLTPLIKAIGTKTALDLLVVGPHSASYEKYVVEKNIGNIRFFDAVQYEQAVEISKQSDVSVVIGNTGGIQIPGKLYFALGLKIPLLYIYQCDNDPALEIIKDMPGVVSARLCDDEIKSVIANWEGSHDALLKESESRVVLPEVKAFEWSKLGESFSNVISQYGK
ncbi:hypothetical protein [Vibrio mexicanus]|uniref:hypothetical protein n=1 Tax=Vibrio mexicanus TaxID=1004326 RepID=UPI00063C4BE8|nr:hypothetical protein [Vibrio mexicanus]